MTLENKSEKREREAGSRSCGGHMIIFSQFDYIYTELLIVPKHFFQTPVSIAEGNNGWKTTFRFCLLITLG